MKVFGIDVGGKKPAKRKSTTRKKSGGKKTKAQIKEAARKRMAKLKRYPSGHKKAGQIMPKRYQ